MVWEGLMIVQRTGETQKILTMDRSGSIEDKYRFQRKTGSAHRQMVRDLMRARRLRGKFFDFSLFSDPAWDILLELYAADLDQQRLAISNVGLTSNIPATTALRWIEALQKDGLIRRLKDPFDGRRWFVELTEKGVAAMQAWFESASTQSLQSRAA
jgi:DNA-binding MarR family transcriptional regulator